MANIVNQYGQVKVGVRTQLTPPPSSLWTSVYSVYNADATGSSSLKTSLFAAYNGESNANDSFGANNGTAQGGLTYTTGKIGNAFNLNGTNSYVSLPNNSFNNLTGDFSVSFWMNSNNSHSTDGGMLFSNMQFPVGVSTYYGFQIGFYNGQIYFTVGNDTGYSTASTRLVSNTLSGYIGTWVYVTCTHKQSTGYKIYVNGVLNNSNNGTYNPVYTTNHTPTIGAQYSVNASPNLVYPFNGKLDAVNIWNKELTQSEITELYNSGNGAQYITDNFYKPTTNDALNTYNGTAQGGLTYGVGKLGTAFVGNGTNAYVRLPDNSLNLTNPFSYSFWIKSSDTTGFTVIVGNVQSARAPYGFAHGYQFWLQYNKINVSFRDGTTSINYGLDSVANVATGSWNHVVITYKYTVSNTDGIKIYINGSLDASRDAPNSNNLYSSPMKPAIMARNPNGSYEYPLSNGTSLDALNIWQKELTQAEITELYNSGNGKQYTN